MDVTSYLLGKNAGGGGGQPTLQEKEITITENGTTSVVADAGYDGLSEVEITTNVSGGGGNYNFKLDMSVSSVGGAQAIATKVVKISPDLDLSQTTNMSYGFAYCINITEIPQLDFSNIQSISNMFESCTNLTTIPVLDFSGVISAENTYKFCPNFTDQTLDNILVSLSMTHLSLSYYKKLSQQGFTASDYPASRIQALPHYQDFINAGWTIGY